MLRGSDRRTAEFHSAVRTLDGILRSQRRYQHARPSYKDIAAACQTLGCKVDTDPKAMKKQYRDMVKKYHPDKPGGSEEKMKTVSTAYTLIKGLSQNEKTAYLNQQSGKTYTTSSSYHRRPEHEQRPGASYTRAPHWTQNPHSPRSQAAYDWQRLYEEQQQRNQHSRYGEYSSRRPGQGHPGMTPLERIMMEWRRKARNMPMGQFLRRALISYLLFALLVSIILRRRQERQEQMGWERAEQQHARERQYGNAPLRQAELEDKKRRANQWAMEKQRELNELERCGFSAFNPTLGYLHRKPSEPEGVVYFEPNAASAGYVPGNAIQPDKLPVLAQFAGATQTPGASQSGQKVQLDLPVGNHDAYMSDRNKALLKQREEGVETYTWTGKDQTEHRTGLLGTFQQGHMAPKAHSYDWSGKQAPGTQAERDSYFPKTAEQQMADIRARQRAQAEQFGLSKGIYAGADGEPKPSQLPPGIQAAMDRNNPTGSAYHGNPNPTQVPVHMVNVHPSPPASKPPAGAGGDGPVHVIVPRLAENPDVQAAAIPSGAANMKSFAPGSV